MKEQWKKIKDYENFEISNLGRIRTIRRYVKNKNSYRLIKQHIIKTRVKDNGYVIISLRKDGERKIKDFYIHRLVAEAFIPNPENKPHINHLDYNKQNNYASNLDWCSRKENQKYSSSRIAKSCLIKFKKNKNHYIRHKSKNCFAFAFMRDKKLLVYKSFSNLEDALQFRNKWFIENYPEIFYNLEEIENSNI